MNKQNIVAKLGVNDTNGGEGERRLNIIISNPSEELECYLTSNLSEEKTLDHIFEHRGRENSITKEEHEKIKEKNSKIIRRRNEQSS
jgi:hypothetical protein